MASLLECSFLIPITSDKQVGDGLPHSENAWEWLRDELFVLFGGGTVAEGFYEGYYTDPDTAGRVSDRSRKFFVAVPDSQIEALRSLLRVACVLFQQKCIYLSVAGHVEFIEPGQNEPQG